MQKLALILVMVCCLTSCKSTKRVTDAQKNTRQITTKHTSSNLANTVVEQAMVFHGVRYKYGGMTKKGMDCSGLVYVAFNKVNIGMPRMSRDMANKGIAIALRDVKKGDLLFFQTNKNKNTINHVGLVINSRLDRIEFIHSTAGKGVITSTLKEPYWQRSFIKARRIL